MAKKLIRPGIFAAMLFFASCASDIGIAKRSDVDLLKLDAASARKEIDELSSTVDELKASAPGEQALSALRESQASLYLQVTQLLKEVQILSGRFDESKFFIDKYLKESSGEMEVMKSKLTSQQEKALLQNVKTRLDAIEAEIKNLSARLAALEKPPAGAEAAKIPPPDEAYDAGLKAFNEKRYDEARQTFDAVVKNYPGHPLSANSRFWIGEIYFSQKKYDDAVLAYQEVIEKHGNSPKVPAALLKQAYAFIEMRDTKAAKGILKEILEKHPKTEQADAAKKKLESLK